MGEQQKQHSDNADTQRNTDTAVRTFSMEPGRQERLSWIACPVCGDTRYRPHWLITSSRFVSYRFVKCRKCGHVYQNPQPLFDDLQGRYAQEYFEYERENEEQFFQLMLKGLEDIDFFSLTESWSRRSGARPLRFLDVGCATGRLLAHLRDRGWEVAGVEICEPAAAFARTERGLPIFVGQLEDSDYAPGSFDVIHFSHVIEHVPDPRVFLARVHELLVPGGLAVIATPDVGGFQAALFRRRWRSAIADHLHLFSHGTLRRLLHKAQFHHVRKVSWGGLAAGTAPPWLKNPADRAAKRFNLGDVMLVLAQKPGSD